MFAFHNCPHTGNTKFNTNDDNSINTWMPLKMVYSMGDDWFSTELEKLLGCFCSLHPRANTACKYYSSTAHSIFLHTATTFIYTKNHDA